MTSLVFQSHSWNAVCLLSVLTSILSSLFTCFRFPMPLYLPFFPSLPLLSVRRFFFPTVLKRTVSNSSNPHETPTASTSPAKYTPQDVLTYRRSSFAYTLTHLSKHNHSHPYIPDPPTPLDEALTHHGLLHEQQVVDNLLQVLSQSTNLPPEALLQTLPSNSPEETLKALQQRVPLIRNPTLRSNNLSAAADLLLRADLDPYITDLQRQASRDDQYIVIEVKLASTCTAEHALQAAAYVNLLNALHDTTGVSSAKWAYVIAGEGRRRLRTAALGLLWRRSWAEFESFVQQFDGKIPLPEGVGEEVRPWRAAAKSVLEDRDSLRLVAGIRAAEISTIEDLFGVSTLEGFARVEEVEVKKKAEEERLGERYVRLWKQARLQMETRVSGTTEYEILWDGGAVLPRRSTDDVVFDMEGFPLVKGGLEYLFGALGGGEFRWWWGHDREQEERAFVRFAEWLEKKLDMGGNVYHYGHYEVTALRRVGLRAMTAEGVKASRYLEEVMEGGRFVDIYKIVRDCMVVGEQSYSIKKIEKLVGISREGSELADAESSVGMYHEWRHQFYDMESQSVGVESSHPILEEILRYNRQDCESLERVIEWLRKVLPEVEKANEKENSTLATAHGEDDDVCTEEQKSRQLVPGSCGPTLAHKIKDSSAIRRCSDLSQLLLKSCDDPLDAEVRRRLSHLLHFYVRESIPARMQFADRINLASGPRYKSLLDDDQCLCAIRFLGRQKEIVAKKEKVTYRYAFPKRQLVAMSSGTSAAFVVPPAQNSDNVRRDEHPSSVLAFLTVKALETSSTPGMGSVSLSAGRKSGFKPPHFGVLVSSEDLKICDAPLRQSLLRIAERIYLNHDDSKVGLVKAFLEKTKIDEETGVDDVSSLFRNRDSRRQMIAEFLATRKQPCVFVVQGPPGSGKSSLSGEIIKDLVMVHGRTVAVSSNSHAAIDNLLRIAIKAGADPNAVWKIGTKCISTENVGFKANLRDLNVTPYKSEKESEVKPSTSSSLFSNSSPTNRKRSRSRFEASLVGATCYQLAREESESKFDLLFIDEASQVPIANFLAMATSAKYAVLVGDQQQLEMPIKGNHPDEIEQSCLSYIVGVDETTVRPSRGVFLEKSYRMHPHICEFVSSSFYENALTPASNCVGNRVHIQESPLGENRILRSGEGLLFVPCSDSPKHTMSEDTSPAYGKWHKPGEVRLIHEVVEELLGCGFTVNGKVGQITESDILVVAPYNAQVRALQGALPDGVRVGTVDKFQGQEAAVAIISTCTSDIDEGIDMEDGTEDNDLWKRENTMPSISGLSRRNHRGLRFALRANRLNVAISRAQCLSIVTGDPNVASKIPMKNLNDVDIAALYELVTLNTGPTDKFAMITAI